MDLSEIFAILLTLFFGSIAVIFSYREERKRRIIVERETAQRQRAYQISLLKEIQDRISYSLDIEEVIDVICENIKNLLTYSTATSLVIKDNRIIFKTYVEESVSKAYIEKAKDKMIDSVSALSTYLPKVTEEKIHGVPLNDSGPFLPISFFHIPININNKVVGLISVTSTKPNFYKEDEVTTLYQISSQASSALSKLQEVLNTEKGKLTSMISSLADGVFMVDIKKELLLINETAKKFLGITKDSTTFFDILSALKGQYDLVAKVEESIEKNQTLEDKEVKINNKVFQTFITPVSTRDGGSPKVIGASILLHDITIEKNLSHMKEDFTNMMVHEIRAPLTAIKDAVELILSDPKNIRTDEQRQMLNLIEQQSKMLLEQVGSILDAAKIEAGSFTVHKVPNDFKALIDQVMETFSAMAKKKLIDLETNLNGDLSEVKFDKIRINQVLNNLISNSLKFTLEGGKITISADYDGSLLKVSVADTGIGIPKQEQADLFSKFYQTQKTPQGLEKKGTGLGLYIVKGIVEAHGGKIKVESEENQGTTIEFTLPT